MTEGAARALERTARAPLVEVFRSIQGEGRCTGQRMVFVRTATCPIRCLYCDTTNSYQAASTFPVYPAAAPATEQRLPEQVRNPIDAEAAADLVVRTFDAPDAVTLTGGEPLVHREFVVKFARALVARGRAVHLETAALHPEALTAALTYLDHVSADFKLPETLADGADHGEAHVACIQAAVAAKRTVDVKVVLTPACGMESFACMLQLLAPFRSEILLILQPVSPAHEVQETLSAEALDGYLEAAIAAGFDARVMVQLHKILNVR